MKTGAAVPLLGLLLTLGITAGCERPLPVDVAVNSDTVESLEPLFASNQSSGAGAAEAELPTPTEFGDFVGLIKLNGQPPAMPALPVTGSDAGYCAPGGKAPLSQEVVVGADNGLANVLVYLDMKIPTTWEHESYAELREALLDGPQGFDQKGCVFLSHVFAMRASQKVEIINSDPVAHNTNIAATGSADTSNNVLPAGSKNIYEPGGASRGPFPVTCSIHPWMKAYMSVMDHPYFAVTDQDGRFSIKNLPAGVDLDFRVWQERVGNNLENVTVNDAATKWSKGRFKLKVEPGSAADWTIVVDAATFQ